METRELECTQCSESHDETGEPLKEHAGEVVMRFCELCQSPTVHLVLSKRDATEQDQVDEMAAVEKG